MSDLSFARPAVDLARLGVAAAPSAGQGLALDETGRIPASVLPRAVAGIVDGPTGNILGGTGFAVVHNSTGNWTITFTTAFAAPPLVLVSSSAGAGITQGFNVPTVSITGFTVFGFDTNAGTARNDDFSFLAMTSR